MNRIDSLDFHYLKVGLLKFEKLINNLIPNLSPNFVETGGALLVIVSSLFSCVRFKLSNNLTDNF